MPNPFNTYINQGFICHKTQPTNTLVLTHLKMKLPTNYKLENYICIHLNVCQQGTDVKLFLLHSNI